jgi:DNA-binding Xre family transcriptional regulator
MISMAPFMRLLAEREIDLEQFSQITQIPINRLAAFNHGTILNQEELDVICHILNCQPCDVVEFRKDKNVGHWEWVND